MKQALKHSEVHPPPSNAWSALSRARARVASWRPIAFAFSVLCPPCDAPLRVLNSISSRAINCCALDSFNELSGTTSSDGRRKLYGREEVSSGMPILDCTQLKTIRNAARIKSRDVTGRAQKGHFMKQRHQVLVKELLQDRREDPERRVGRIEEISLAHAKRSMIGELQGDATDTEPKTPSRPSHKSTSSAFKSPRLTSGPNSIGKRKGSRANRSKILESLDINDCE